MSRARYIVVLLVALVCLNDYPFGPAAAESRIGMCPGDKYVTTTDANGVQTIQKLPKITPIQLLLEEVARLKTDIENYPPLKRQREALNRERLEVSPTPAPQVAVQTTEKPKTDRPTFSQRYMGAATSGYRLFCCKRTIVRDESTYEKPQEKSSADQESSAKSADVISAAPTGSHAHRIRTLLERLAKA